MKINFICQKVINPYCFGKNDFMEDDKFLNARYLNQVLLLLSESTDIMELSYKMHEWQKLGLICGNPEARGKVL